MEKNWAGNSEDRMVMTEPNGKGTGPQLLQETRGGGGQHASQKGIYEKRESLSEGTPRNLTSLRGERSAGWRSRPEGAEKEIRGTRGEAFGKEITFALKKGKAGKRVSPREGDDGRGKARGHE